MSGYAGATNSVEKTTHHLSLTTKLEIIQTLYHQVPALLASIAKNNSCSNDVIIDKSPATYGQWPQHYSKRISK